jgi:hypothetical protein
VIRIVGVQRSAQVTKEFVLLQNQGSLRLNLRGHLIASENAIHSADLTFAAHAFSDDVLIPPGMYVILFSGSGVPKWTKSKDGSLVYYTFMNRSHSVWENAAGPINLLNTQHTYAERPPALLLR